jgi:NIPSNAP
MRRRTFITSLFGTTLLAATASARTRDDVSQQPAAAPAAPDVYVWRQYVLRAGTQPRRVADFLQNAAVPALNRLGHRPVGVFEAVAGATSPAIFTLTPFASIDDVASLEARLDADETFTRAATPYLDAPAIDPAFIRQEVSLLTAFPSFPHVVVPAATAAKGPRLFELRTYESPSERAHRAKVKMFAEMGEIEIFRRVGLTPVFFSRTLVGPRMPSLVYMLVHENLAAREKTWSAFGADAEWRKLAQTPGYTDPEIVSNITTVFLRPASYSQI